METRTNDQNSEEKIHTSKDPGIPPPVLMCSGKAADEHDLFAPMNDYITCPGCVIGLVHLAVTHITAKQHKNV